MLKKTLEELYNEGYAIVMFTPEELQGADSNSVEDRLVELGWEIINDLKPNEEVL
jgi:hypothetical protein